MLLWTHTKLEIKIEEGILKDKNIEKIDIKMVVVIKISLSIPLVF